MLTILYFYFFGNSFIPCSITVIEARIKSKNVSLTLRDLKIVDKKKNDCSRFSYFRYQTFCMHFKVDFVIYLYAVSVSNIKILDIYMHQRWQKK